MVQSFYFYDVETSGRDPRLSRIMQFAGQRTDNQLKPIGQPHNIMIKLTPDVLPEPDAILTHGITPQQSLEEGVTEAEFLKLFDKEIATAGTTFVGYNNIRFDDEFIRFSLWRNFYDAYEWQWKDGASRWDMLDVARTTRALRPDGIKWPADDANNRLEILASLNQLKHTDAHDALSDVGALIDLAKLIKDKQPKLFDYLFGLRDKNKVLPFINSGKPFVHTSGRYPKEYAHTTIVATVAEHPQKQSVLVYDLRVDPSLLLKQSVEELAEAWRYKPWVKDADKPAYFPVKELAPNRCPSIAPLNVITSDKQSLQRLQLDMNQINANYKKLQAAKGFDLKLIGAYQLLHPQPEKPAVTGDLEADSQLYNGFIEGSDKVKLRAVRATKPEEIRNFLSQFTDERLNALLPLYKARNYPKSLTDEERTAWEDFCRRRLTHGGQQSQAVKFFERLNRLGSRTDLTKEQRYLLEELSLYAQSIAPVE